MAEINIWIVIGAALLTGLTPGPVMLAIAGTAMARGRRHGFAVTYGITAGASVWAVLSALGMGALLTANQWLFETLRYAGAAYLAWLGVRAARSAFGPDRPFETKDLGGSYKMAALRGALIHLTNPKALFFWGSIFAIGAKPDASPSAVVWIVGLSMAVNITLVTTWAVLFSTPALMAAYLRFRRWIEGIFAGFFGAAAVFVVANRSAD
ncbi:LysE family translocator [Pseudaestuariivita rosea]|uniref:LysE family translocator n=1 Tax=Pseudaestuariivita rosea TaxID=2763263 RepID=UPI001ABA70B8|nr:LysE family translocator [Pseudaestuariivita rosea]